MRQPQRGSTFLGLILGIVIGLGAALAVAVYVTKVPVPFLHKGQARTPEQDAAETRKNQNWDPNAPLYGKNPARTASGAAQPAASAASAAVADKAKDKDEKPVPRAAASAASAPAQPVPPAVAGRPPSADPLGDFAAARAGSDPFQYFVQAGAFRSAEEAEAQRAKLSLMGVEAKVSEREQAGRQVYRVRVGPFDRREDADRTKEKLDGGGFETALVRVQR